MKNTEIRYLRRLLVVTAAAFLAGAIGYGMGRGSRKIPQTGIVRWDAVASPQEADSSLLPDRMSPAEHAKFVAGMRKRLSLMWRTSPYCLADWELLRETHRLLSRLTADELASLYHQSGDSTVIEDLWLRNQLLTEWALKDAPAAVTQSPKDKDTPYASISAFKTWAFHDPDRALLWLRDVQLPPLIEDRKSEIRLDFLGDYGQVDFERAQQELPYMDALERTRTLNIWAGNGPDDPAFRKRLKELESENPDLAHALVVEKSAVRRLAETDLATALERIEKMDLSDSDKVELDVDLLRGQVNKQPEQAFRSWLDRNASLEIIPESVWPVMDQTFTFHPDDIIRWLDSISPGQSRDAFYERGTRLVAAHQQFEKAASYADAIADPAKRLAALRTLNSMWTASQPDKAGAWLENLTESDRQALGN